MHLSLEWQGIVKGTGVFVKWRLTVRRAEFGLTGDPDKGVLGAWKYLIGFFKFILRM